jgi:hypothetical protein
MNSSAWNENRWVWVKIGTLEHSELILKTRTYIVRPKPDQSPWLGRKPLMLISIPLFVPLFNYGQIVLPHMLYSHVGSTSSAGKDA